MSYNVPVHQLGLYLLCIWPEPSMDPSSTPMERGNSLCAMLSSQHCSDHQSERLKIKGLAFFTPPYLFPTVRMLRIPAIFKPAKGTRSSR